ncbi:MAG: hypothetical protein ACYSTS_06010 [Planctomycetota bacterium]|jgi:hypothetical protein
MKFFKALTGKSKKKQEDAPLLPNEKLSSKVKLTKAIMYTCITFFVMTVVFVTLTYYGKWQAGLIEVSSAAFLFVIFLHILKIVVPQYSGKIITALSVIIAIILIYVNFSLQKSEHKEYTFKELLVGDLLVDKLVGKEKKLKDKLLAKKLKSIIPGEFARMKTEKDTIESPFEKPEKDLMGRPISLPLDKPNDVSLRQEKSHPFSIPKETTNYKLVVAYNEGLKIDRARMVTVDFVVQPEKLDEQISGPHLPTPLYLPSEVKIDYNLLKRTIYDKPEQPAAISESEIQTAPSEKSVVEETGKQVEEKLQTQ